MSLAKDILKGRLNKNDFQALDDEVNHKKFSDSRLAEAYAGISSFGKSIATDDSEKGLVQALFALEKAVANPSVGMHLGGEELFQRMTELKILDVLSDLLQRYPENEDITVSVCRIFCSTIKSRGNQLDRRDKIREMVQS